MSLSLIATARRRLELVLPGIILVLCAVVAPVLMVFATRSIATVLIAGFVISGVALVLRGRPLPVPPSGHRLYVLTGSFAAFLCWASLSILWATDRPAAVGAAGQLWLLALTGMVGLLCLPLVMMPRRSTPWLALGLVLTTGLIISEFVLDFPIRQALQPIDAKALPGSQLNRSVIVLALFLWPALEGLRREGRPLPAFLLFAVVAAGVMISDSQAAQLGLLTGSIVFAATLVSPRRTAVGVVGGAVVVMLLSPLLFAHLSSYLPERLLEALAEAHALHRLEIWDRYSTILSERWITGFGLDASGSISSAPVLSALPPAAVEALKSGHPHNAVLQIWVELGLVGALLAAVTLGALGGLVSQGNESWGSLPLAAFACGFSIACVGHGAWQSWWLASLLATAAWFLCVRRAP
jgi:O-antigen ligase